ncbi:MAG: hypothetical protein K0B07_02075 [DPANN group archaeon]|nr:hypothetical protein [DPANN group archaeon]
MIEFLFAVMLGVGSVVLATISVGNLVHQGEKKEIYDISISLYKINGIESTGQELNVDGKIHNYTVSKIGNNKLLVGEGNTPLNEATVLKRIGDQYVGHTKDPNIVELLNHLNTTDKPTKKDTEYNKNPSDEIDWIK